MLISLRMLADNESVPYRPAAPCAALILAADRGHVVSGRVERVVSHARSRRASARRVIRHKGISGDVAQLSWGCSARSGPAACTACMARLLRYRPPTSMVAAARRGLAAAGTAWPNTVTAARPGRQDPVVTDVSVVSRNGVDIKSGRDGLAFIIWPPIAPHSRRDVGSGSTPQSRRSRHLSTVGDG